MGPAGLARGALLTSTDWDRPSFSALISLRGSEVVLAIPQCWASSDRLSSMGVNILRLAGGGFGIRLGWFSGGLCSRSGCGGDDMDGGWEISC